jgi:hypothetical protein
MKRNNNDKKADAAESQSAIKQIKNRNNRIGIVVKQYPTNIVELFDKGELPEIVELDNHIYQLDFELTAINIDVKSKVDRAIKLLNDAKYAKRLATQAYENIKNFKGEQAFEAEKEAKKLQIKADTIEKEARLAGAISKNALIKNTDEKYELNWTYTDITLEGIARPKLPGINKIELNKLTRPVLDLAIKKADMAKRKASKTGASNLRKPFDNYSRKIENMQPSQVPEDHNLLLRWLAIRYLKINSIFGAKLIIQAYNEYYNIGTKCLICKKSFSAKHEGRKAKYCSDSCRQKAYRCRK